MSETRKPLESEELQVLLDSLRDRTANEIRVLLDSDPDMRDLATTIGTTLLEASHEATNDKPKFQGTDTISVVVEAFRTCHPEFKKSDVSRMKSYSESVSRDSWKNRTPNLNQLIQAFFNNGRLDCLHMYSSRYDNKYAAIFGREETLTFQIFFEFLIFAGIMDRNRNLLPEFSE